MSNKKVEPVYDPITLAIEKQALEIAERRMNWARIKKQAVPIVNALNDLGIEVTYSNDIDFSFTGDAHKLAAVVRILRTAGYNTDTDKPKQGDNTWYAFYRKEGCVRICLYFTSSVCKRVKTGTKMVEVDVYETQCGDIADPTADELPAPQALLVQDSEDESPSLEC